MLIAVDEYGAPAAVNTREHKPSMRDDEGVPSDDHAGTRSAQVLGRGRGQRSRQGCDERQDDRQSPHARTSPPCSELRARFQMCGLPEGFVLHGFIHLMEASSR